jgi:hypothetical protein
MVVGALNLNFISLIAKCDKPTSFSDYMPISLCNLVYKIITKIIANRLNLVLSKSLSLEQFGFLLDRQIMDVVGVTQEAIHSIKMRHMKSLVLKLDLHKAYDCIRWDFLRLVLLQIGLNLQVTNWILGFVSSTSFVVLVNGGPL